ncbi:uncharacterized protein LOC129285531 [Prosopis cineraria]|uniref:uncharacterized protein LOC129285531 n=1 Tax=Prosopis cineraria TaxID=364024 RepID=UPI00240F21DE|nr:uncharacterized protein LOC129285531 [Prosopis cineraria]
MAKTIAGVMSDTCHGLCTFHVQQNAIKHLGNFMREGSHFLKEFNACMHHYEDKIEFEEAWSRLPASYEVQDNTWLTRLYSIKEKWAACYMKSAFTLGIKSTQVSESINANIKSWMQSEIDIVQFVKDFETVIENKRYNELKCEFDARQAVPRLRSKICLMLNQLAKVYTFTILDLFQEEWDLYLVACVKHMVKTPLLDEIDGSPSLDRTPFLVEFIITVIGNEIKGDAKIAIAQRYRQLCRPLTRLATDASNSHGAFNFVHEAIDDLTKQVIDKFFYGQISTDNDSENDTMNESNMVRGAKVVGFKKKQGIKGRKGGKRKKPWPEKQPKKKTKAATSANKDKKESQVKKQSKEKRAAYPMINPLAAKFAGDIAFTSFTRAQLNYSAPSLRVTSIYSCATSFSSNED